MSKGEHRENALWSDYILGKLPPEKEQKLENLLIEDEETFQMYLHELEELKGELPTLGNQELFTHSIISALPSSKKRGVEQAVKSKVSSSRNLPFYHYLIAASITLLLMGSGFFDLLSIEAGQSMDRNRTVSISDKWMNVTSKWMDSLRDPSPKK
ncbi:hypothetical protein D3C78_896130 [compost metagenome]